MRLACVKHAASVRSEPGSNSQVHLRAGLRQHKSEQIPSLISGPSQPLAGPELQNLTSVICNAFKNTSRQRPSGLFPDNRTKSSPFNQLRQNPVSSNARAMNDKDAANVSLPSLFDFQRAPGEPGPRGGRTVRCGRRVLGPGPSPVNANKAMRYIFMNLV